MDFIRRRTLKDLLWREHFNISMNRRHSKSHLLMTLQKRHFPRVFMEDLLKVMHKKNLPKVFQRHSTDLLWGNSLPKNANIEKEVISEEKEVFCGKKTFLLWSQDLPNVLSKLYYGEKPFQSTFKGINFRRILRRKGLHKVFFMEEKALQKVFFVEKLKF